MWQEVETPYHKGTQTAVLLWLGVSPSHHTCPGTAVPSHISTAGLDL
jgi:hypothetical protein